MKRFILILFIIFSAFFASGQKLNKAIGLRGGLTSGFEYRFYADETTSLKFLLGTNNGVRLHGMVEFHQPNLFLFTDQLTLFYGVGMHCGYEHWEEKRVNENHQWYDNRNAFVMGIDGIMGIEYSFIETPLTVGIESKPYFDIFGKNMFHFEPFDFAFTVKYLF